MSLIRPGPLLAPSSPGEGIRALTWHQDAIFPLWAGPSELHVHKKAETTQWCLGKWDLDRLCASSCSVFKTGFVQSHLGEWESYGAEEIHHYSPWTV